MTPPKTRTLRIGSRGSRLALTQSGQVAAAIEAATPGLRVEIEVIRTTGDRQQGWKETPAALGAGGGKGLFTKELEEALLSRRIDAAVHSMKDMPTEIPEGLQIAAIPRREDPHDVVVTRSAGGLDGLGAGAAVGTGSPRRIAQIRNARPDLRLVPIRGNVDTRMKKVEAGELDGVVLAAAGLRRLGLDTSSAVALPPSICLPAPGQGALAVEARSEEGWVLDALHALHDAPSAAAVAAERAFLEDLGGGCLVPAAALAEAEGEDLRLRVAVAEPDGSRVVRAEVRGPAASAEDLGRRAAAELASAGGAGILAALRESSGG